MKRSDISDLAVCRAAAEYRRRNPPGPATIPNAAYFRSLARKAKEPQPDPVFITDILAEMFPGAPPKVIRAAMERADDREYIEYGVSLRTAWLTEKGKALLAEAGRDDG